MPSVLFAPVYNKRVSSSVENSLLLLLISLFLFLFILLWLIRFLCCFTSAEFVWSAITSSCMPVNHGPSQQNCKEYWSHKWGATARCYASHRKTMLPTRKSVPRSSRQSDHTKTSWQYCKEMQTAMVCTCLPFIRPGQKHFARHSQREKKIRETEEEVGRQQSGNWQAWSSSSPIGQWRTEKKWRKLVVKSSVMG